MKGRPRKPQKLHLLDGTFRKDRHGQGQEPEATGKPIKPDAFKGEASKFWDQVVPGLVKSGVAKKPDTAALVALCESWGRYRKFSRALDRVGAAHKDAGRLAKMLDAALKAFERLAARFGLTPADRARLKVTSQEPADQFADFLNRCNKPAPAPPP